MKMFAMCRNCGRSLATSNGVCRMCLLRRIPQRRIKRTPLKKQL